MIVEETKDEAIEKVDDEDNTPATIEEESKQDNSANPYAIAN